MAETPRSTHYCLTCGATNERDAALCRACASPLALSERQRREGAAFFLNELETLRAEGSLGEATYAYLRQRYLAVIMGQEPPAAQPLRQPAATAPAPRLTPTPPVPAPAPTATTAMPPAPAQPSGPPRPVSEGPGWLAEQQANLLLYLGAFLIVIATIVFVSASGDAVGPGIRMALLVIGTLLFLAGGLFCHRIPRVQEAGVVFFAVGALMVPLNFVGAYAFFFSENDIDPAGLWLAGSLTSAIFYGAVSFTGLSRWYPVPAVVALLSALASVLYLTDAPPEAYPASYIGLAFVLLAPATMRLRRASEVFGPTGAVAAQAIVPAGFLAAICIAAVASGESAEEALELTTRWYLPPTLGLAATFYATVSFTGIGRWSPPAAAVSLLGVVAAILYASNAPVEVHPASYIVLGFLLVAPATMRLGRASEVFAPVGGLASHIIVAVAAMVAVYVAAVASGQSSEEVLELRTRWYLPPTLGLAAAFYWVTATAPPRPAVLPREADFVFTIAALVVSGAAGVSVLFGLEAGTPWYGVAIAIIGWLYAAGSPGFGPRWSGQRYLGWLALVTITASWLVLADLYTDYPRIGAGINFSAALFYLAAARVVPGKIELFPLEASSADDAEDAQPTMLTVPAAATFIYATGLTLALGYYYVLASLPAAEGAEASDLGLPFFYLSLGVIAVAVAMRWLWPEMRLHAYAVAIGLSLFVLLSSTEAEGRVALLLAIYGGIAFAIALWELEAFALVLPATYGFFALLAAWRYYTPDDAYLPLIIAFIAWTLYATYAALREQERRWADVLLALAFGYAALAPIVGWVRLSQLADPEGFVGTQSFEATALYQTSAAGVALLGLLVGAEAWLRRRPEIAVGASALLMVALLLEVGHFRPENVQAYTAPLGVYLLAGALLGLRVRDLPRDLRELLGPIEALSAALIVGPSLVQSFDEGAWRYGVIVLAEGLALVALALVQRRVWLLGVSVGFVVLDSVHYLIEAGVPPIPTWAILAIAGIAVMAAGTAILLGRDRWTEWQQAAIAWWYREPPPVGAEQPR
ncbi:MAG: hypothetical protein WEE64_08815 [Dehalococcoidia bacterium]